jgi:hypothetical protein
MTVVGLVIGPVSRPRPFVTSLSSLRTYAARSGDVCRRGLALLLVAIVVRDSARRPRGSTRSRHSDTEEILASNRGALMDWHAEVTAEFTRRGIAVDDSVVEEMAQHARAAYDAARADGLTVVTPKRRSVRSFARGAVRPWVLDGSNGCRSQRRSRGACLRLALDFRQAFRRLRRQPASRVCRCS